MKSWKFILPLAIFIFAVTWGFSQLFVAHSNPKIVVYKSPTCGCCGKWEEHLRASGFEVDSRPTEAMNPVKASKGVPSDLRSCHTAEVDGYVVEGHVPASSIKKMLAEKPKIKGIAVPGMPIGSPGMEGPNPESYDVLTFSEGRTGEVFERF